MIIPLGSAREGAERYVRSTLNPAGFHGERVEKSFFEGWYVKLVGADQSDRWAVIPGIFLGPEGESDVFVQVLNGSTGQSWYHQFDRADFRADPYNFDIQVGPNRFTERGVELDLPSLQGSVQFTDALNPWPVTVSSPGIMGWYGWVPTMECYHGLCSFDHGLAGSLTSETGSMDFAGGRGYIEKDWGKGFPAGYVWMQTNHFATKGTSLSASIALIPWRGAEFRGFIVGLQHRGKLIKFATHTGAKTRTLVIDDDHVRWTMTNRQGLHLSLEADRPTGGLLHAPVRTQMHRRVEETLDATVRVRLTDRTGRVLFDDQGTSAGLEVHGDLERLTTTT